jgi:hypothetical protein
MDHHGQIVLKKIFNRECYVNLNVECIKRDAVEDNDDLFVIGAAGGVFNDAISAPKVPASADREAQRGD